MDEDNRLLSTREVAIILFGSFTETSRKRVMRMAKSGSVEPIRDGNRFYFRRADVSKITNPKQQASGIVVGSRGLSLGN
jgi:nucleoid DNA-binding protein|tara:strand:- start:263 stop:499 length:237 start_codon:yes stop_codon:yes gene_type:complete